MNTADAVADEARARLTLEKHGFYIAAHGNRWRVSAAAFSVTVSDLTMLAAALVDEHEPH